MMYLFKAQKRQGGILPYGLAGQNTQRVHPIEQDSEMLAQEKVASVCSWQETVKRSEGYRSAIVSNRNMAAEQASLFAHVQEERMEELYMLLPYFKTASFILLALVDLSIAFALHLAGSKFDFLCEVGASSYSESDLLEEHYFVDKELGGSPAREDIMVVLWMLIVAHLIVFVCNIFKTHETGRYVGLRYFYSTTMYDQEEILTHYLHTILMMLSMIFLMKHKDNCARWAKTGEQPENHLSVVKTHSHVHMTRGICTVIQCFGMSAYLRKQLQTVVSTNKRRFVSHEMAIDLDLTYICDRIIAMAMPAVKNAVHRNDIQDVAKFFATRHYGSFVVYNLCEHHEEEGNGNYDTSILFGQVHKIPFHDHNPPPLMQLVRFCQSASHFLNKSPKHTVAVHCRGGKGRTGLFISSLMLWTNMKMTAASALDEFAHRRTARLKRGDSVQGVTAPGQLRYIHYLEAYMYHNVAIFSDSWVLLNRIGIVGMKEKVMMNKALSFVVECNQEIQYDHGKFHGLSSYDDLRDINGFEIPQIALRGDVRVRFFLFDSADVLPLESQKANSTSLPKRRRGALGPGATTLKYGGVEGRMCFFICFHTAFIENGTTSFSKREIDHIYEYPESSYSKDFGIDLDMIIADTPQNICSSSAVRARRASSDYHTMDFEELIDGTDFKMPTDVLIANRSYDDASSTNPLDLHVPFMPPKVLPSFRHVHTIAAVRDIFERLSPETIEVAKSDIIVSDTNEFQRTVVMITCGELLESPLMQMEEENTEDQDRSFHNAVHGAYAVVGVIEFMKGQTNLQGSTKVFSKTASLRRISIPHTDSSVAPLIIPGTSPSESGLVYRYFALQMLARSRSIRGILAQASETSATSTTIVKDVKGGSSMLREAQITSAITQRFGFAITERLIHSGSAQLSEDNGNTSSHGKLCLFHSWIVFLSRQGFARKDRDILISVRKISKAKRHANTVTIDMLQDNPGNSYISSLRHEISTASAIDTCDAERPWFQRFLNVGWRGSRSRSSMAMIAGKSTLNASARWGSTESYSFVFLDAEMAEHILSIVTEHMQIANEVRFPKKCVACAGDNTTSD